MALYAVPGEALTGIADAIRSKTGSDDQMPVAAFAAAIESISGGGGGAVPTKTFVDDEGTDSTYRVYRHVVDAMTVEWTVLFAFNKDFDISTNNCVIGMLIGKNNLCAVMRFRDGAFNTANYGTNTSGVIKPGSAIEIYKLF